MLSRGRLRALLLALTVLALVTGTGASASAANSRSPIEGSGSSWSSNAVNQWIADVEPRGLRVVFTASGSAQGRKDFAQKSTDFAVSDIGFQGADSATGATDTSLGRQFAYLPIVAGGTSFPYQLRVGGKLVRNVRLSGPTIAKIFTNQIRNWNDPAITADNNGRKLPSTPIIPVVHSEGSGSTAQLTTYLDRVHPGIWRPFFGRSGFTEYFPRKGDAVAQNGSDGVINYIASKAGNGSIGYDEYSYALAKSSKVAVAKVRNVAGFYTLPSQYNVAVALRKADIDYNPKSPTYLLQDLRNVYVNPDARTYPLSSYSYGIIPTASNDPRMSTPKRQTLVDYLYYSICDGQKEMGPIGYSPLPINLVNAAFDQINKLKAADAGVDLTERNVSTCRNPTFVAGNPNRNYLAEIAPYPAACDQDGKGPCSGEANPTLNRNPGQGGPGPGTGSAGPTSAPTTGTNGGGGGGTAGGGGSGGGGSGGGGGASGPTATAGNGAVTGGGNPAAAPTAGTTGAGGATTVDPATGQVVAAGGQDSGTTDLIGSPTDLAASRSSSYLGPLAALLLLAAVIAPPLVARRLVPTRKDTP